MRKTHSLPDDGRRHFTGHVRFIMIGVNNESCTPGERITWGLDSVIVTEQAETSAPGFGNTHAGPLISLGQPDNA